MLLKDLLEPYKKNNIYKYNNTHHRNIKMKPVHLNQRIYIDFNKENNQKGPKLKVGDNVRISKYKNILQKAMFQICLKKLL